MTSPNVGNSFAYAGLGCLLCRSKSARVVNMKSASTARAFHLFNWQSESRLRQPNEVLHERRRQLENELDLSNDDGIVVFDIGVLVLGVASENGQ